MEIAAKYKSALSGVEHGNDNSSIALIKASSTNAYKDAYIRVITGDDNVDDNNSNFLAGPSVYGGGTTSKVRDDGSVRKSLINRGSRKTVGKAKTNRNRIN
jgi:hypothetical protein